MNTTFATESRTSQAPGIIPETPLVHGQPNSPVNRRSPRDDAVGTARPARGRTPLARVLAALRGDKYMVDAYPPVEPPALEG
jgi:hypothetical protein